MMSYDIKLAFNARNVSLEVEEEEEEEVEEGWQH